MNTNIKNFKVTEKDHKLMINDFRAKIHSYQDYILGRQQIISI